MATTSRQTAIFGVEDWKKIYQTYAEADFQSYDFETLRKTFIDYLRVNYPETFNDYTESSEFIALLDLMAFMGQGLSFRNDLNTRENFIDTAERRDSVVRLANLVGYTPKRNEASKGYLKITKISTTENVLDYNRNNLANSTINWNDTANPDWLEQFNAIINASLVNSQKVGRPGNTNTILGTKTDEYAVNLVNGYLPVIPFSATVDDVNMSFEAISVTSNGKSYLYENAPQPNSRFNLLFRNDQLGYASANTGFFVYFKQGVLQNQDFNLNERISNRVVSLGVEGVNNDDVWLYKLDQDGNIDIEWDKVDNIFKDNSQGGTISEKNFFSVSSRSNDQIDLNFGDGVFSNIPVGVFRSYIRASNGLTYVINPEEMQSIEIPIAYVSRTGRTETLTLTASLQEPVSNARARETILDIKSRAPARFYTQNRMVNGEDYTNLPYSLFGSIIKSSAINRSSIGTSRYLDLVDVTGKYSSTNVFGSDGVLYEENAEAASTFTWNDANDIVNAITTVIEPAIGARQMLHFYYRYYARPGLSSLNLTWNQSTAQTNSTTGYFKTDSDAPKPIGEYSSDNTSFITEGALVKFEAPAGYYFDKNNRLKVGSPTKPEDTLVIWSTITDVTLDGTNFGIGNFDDGTGPVTLNQYIPGTAVPTEVIPVFSTDLPQSIETQIIAETELYRDFGIRYDNTTRSWKLITTSNLDVDAEFSLANAGSTLGTGTDASWLIQCTTDGETYTVKSRNLDYYFASVVETRFFFDSNENIYDSKTGSTINDFVEVLRSNNQPDSASPLRSAVKLDIIDQPLLSDGFRDDFRVSVSFTDSDSDGVPDNPDVFETIVAPDTNPTDKLVFLQSTTDFDNLERYLPLDSGTVNTEYATLDAIELDKNQFADGQLFYATTAKAFYELDISAGGVRTINSATGLATYTGRQDLNFQYRHNASLSRRIDPGVTNIIDLYLLTGSYYQDYLNYIRDLTGTVAQPSQPTVEELTTLYQGLDEYKMMSDTVIPNPATFKQLFGSKADTTLQAVIKVIKNQGSTISNSEIKSEVISAINRFFNIENWDFGQTFYFSELSSYLHREIGDIVSSVVLVPRDTTKTFGDLYEVRSAPNEIVISSATVDDVDVVTSLTSTTLNQVG